MIGASYSISFVSFGENYPLINLRDLYADIFSVGVLGGVGVEMRIINEFSLYLVRFYKLIEIFTYIYSQ